MKNRLNLAVRATAGAAAVTALAGCSWFGGGGGGGGRGQDLDATHRFVTQPIAPEHTTGSAVDQPGYIAPPGEVQDEHVVRTNPLMKYGTPEAVGGQGTKVGGAPGGPLPSPAASAPPVTPGPATKPSVASTPTSPLISGTTPDVAAIPDVIREQVNPATTNRPVEPGNIPTATGTSMERSASVAATRRAGRSLGSYLTLGGVVAEVNNRPIYANQVLREIVAPLSAQARQLDESAFRRVAADLIDQQIKRLANNERETAVAERNLDEKEKDTARLAAARWRQRQITESGGSLELAKRKWAAEGYDFEDRVDQEYRNLMVQLYYSKKVWPRVQVTANEIRRYYDQHVNDEFTDRAQVRFRLIKVDPKRTGGREQALNKIKDLRARAARGEDFAEMASSVNDDKYLMTRGGDVGWVQKGAYANEQVEKAVWDLQPGQVSDIIDAGGAFYIAKVEERKLGRTMPFDEQAVQEKIQKQLRAEQFRQLRDHVLDTLTKNSVLRTDTDMVNTAIDMAVQNYPRWHSGEPVGTSPESMNQ